MKFAAFAVLAGCALASASVVRRGTTADVYLKVLQCYEYAASMCQQCCSRRVFPYLN
jgi:hypothetical protein